jgi:hypothetical protein
MSRDLRKYASQTTVRLIIGALLVLFTIGIGLIYLFYGKAAAFLGLLCLLAGLVPVVLIVFILLFLDWIRKRAERD